MFWKMNEGAPERIATVDDRRERLRETKLVMAVCAAFGHATSTQRSADVGWKGKPKPRERGPTNLLK